MINLPKGTKDLLPSEAYKWQYVEKTAREIAELFNVKEIRTPTFEHTEVFLRGVGETTDIVNKEMYTFNDKGDRSITLKPEGTAGVARAFVENGLYGNVLPSKLYYITSCFRYERPQAGRLREFHQFGVEFLGSPTADTDAEAIVLAKTFFDKLGVSGLTLYINSIGCPNCRAKYEEALKEYLNKNKSKLCELCQERLDKNPLRVFDCKNPDCKEIVKNAPKILDYICDDCKSHFEKVQSLLKVAGVDYEIDSEIVRGLDYYTRTVFEFVSTNIGAQGTVCGGGRYNNLVAEFGGPDTPGIGFAMGIERLLLLMDSLSLGYGEQKDVKVYIASMGEKEAETAFTFANELRKKGVIAEIDHMARGIKSQFKYADKIKAKYVAVIGSDELNEKKLKVKNMTDGQEKFVSFDEFCDYIVKA